MAHCLNKSVESELRAISGNFVCCDCDDKNPQWASVSFGVFMCLECSGRHRALGVHISFVRSVSMDSWTDKQISMMRQGGNDEFNVFLEKYSVKKSTPIPQKYNTPAAQLYRDRLSAKIEGRELPTQLPKDTSSPGSTEGTDPMPGESEADYVVRQRLLQEKARERMKAKFGASQGLNGKMGGIGSDPNYNPNKAGNSGDVSEIASGALSFVSSSLGKVSEKVASGESWSFLKSGATDLWNKASSVVADVVAAPAEDQAGNLFGIAKDHFKKPPLGCGNGASSSQPASASASGYRASPTNVDNRTATPSPTQSSEDLAAIQAIKNMNLDGPKSRNSSSNSLSSGNVSRSSSSSSVNKPALAPAGDDFFASFGAK